MMVLEDQGPWSYPTSFFMDIPAIAPTPRARLNMSRPVCLICVRGCVTISESSPAGPPELQGPYHPQRLEPQVPSPSAPAARTLSSPDLSPSRWSSRRINFAFAGCQIDSTLVHVGWTETVITLVATIWKTCGVSPLTGYIYVRVSSVVHWDCDIVACSSETF